MPIANKPMADTIRMEAKPHSVSITPAAKTIGA